MKFSKDNLLTNTEPSSFNIPDQSAKELFDHLARRTGISRRGQFAAGWAQRKQDRYETQFEAQLGVSNHLPFQFLEKGVCNGRAVCKIEAAGLNYCGKAGSWVGTGFLVDPGVLLTNHHVLNSIEVAKDAEAIFNYYGDLKVVRYSLDPDELFITSPAVNGLDYTFVAVKDKSEAPLDEFGNIIMCRGAFTTEFMRRANIIQHPGGYPKTVVLQENELLPDNDPLFLHYISDTQGGSSGSPVFDNNWQLKALHHAGRKNLDEIRMSGSSDPAPKRLNEGVKLSAIAADLELRSSSGKDRAEVMRILRLMEGNDSYTGYFGVRGRKSQENTLEAVVQAYFGKEQDIDIAFWNIEWFCKNYLTKLADVAGVIADKNIDIWAFSESSPEATQALVNHLAREFGQRYAFAASEPDASSGRQTTTVMWNMETVRGVREEWPQAIDEALRKDSREYDDINFEAVEGKIFNRYPGLFHFTALNREAPGCVPFDFYLVPLHLKAMDEGSKRRKMACELLAKAIDKMIADGKDKDWILGGDFNAEINSGDFDPLNTGGFHALSARDEADGMFTYLSRRHRSLIDHIYLSPDMVNRNDQDFFILAEDKRKASFADDISDHRPVVARLSLETPHAEQEDICMAKVANLLATDPAGLLRSLIKQIEQK